MKTQIEIQWDQPEPFTLVPQTTTDGDRIVEQQQQTQKDKAENDKNQLFIDQMKSLF